MARRHDYRSHGDHVIDPDNPVVKLCAAGIEAEMQGRHDEARALYRQAWESRGDDYEACIAAHYVARQQETLADSLAWNQAALAHALATPVERIGDFLPSLYLNLGWSHEVLGDTVQARACYIAGEERLAGLPAGAYTDMVRDGIARGLERTASG